MKLTRTRIFDVTVEVKTGLHIGGTADNMQIGGPENAVIKDKQNNPYIPGSSLKGKIRSILESKRGTIGAKGGPHAIGECGEGGVRACPVCRFFGVGGYATSDKKATKDNAQEDEVASIGPTRLLFRDLMLSDETKKEYEEMRTMGRNPLEEKTEIAMDRRRGTALGGALRPFERVPAGAVFTGELLVREYELADGIVSDEKLFNQTFGSGFEEVIKLLEGDYLGGQGSRGSGQIKITFDERTEKASERAQRA